MLVVAALFIGGIAVSSTATDAARGDHHKECGGTDPIITEANTDQPVTLQFMGYYHFTNTTGARIQTTNILNVTLGPGEFLNWDEINAAYADWVAGGGLSPNESAWHVSGPNATQFTFAQGDSVSYSEFTGSDNVYYVDPGYITSVGFIGHYVYNGQVLQTSFYWQDLVAGQFIDWTAVDAAYDAWVAQGGLAPQKDLCQTSGPSPITFQYGDPTIGYSDFTNTQLETLYQSFYVDPGYIAPAPAIEVGFIGYYVNDGKVMNTSFYWQEIQPGDTIDWAAVDAAYADWVARGGLAPDGTLWQTSGYASFTFGWYESVSYSQFTGGQLEGYYGQFYVDPGYIAPAPVSTDQPPVFEIAIFKPKTGSTNDVFVNGVNVGSMKVESKTFVVDGYNIIIKLNNRGSGNDTWIYDFTYEIVKL